MLIRRELIMFSGLKQDRKNYLAFVYFFGDTDNKDIFKKKGKYVEFKVKRAQ